MAREATSASTSAAGDAAAFLIPSLDGIRAVAFLVVFTSHALPRLHVPGQFGVTVFFFLSGYLITTLLRREFVASGGISLRGFYLRRTLRIFPPFYLVLALATGIGLYLTPNEIDGHAVAALAAYWGNYWAIAHNWAGIPTGTSVYWSLAVEEHFYLLFPFFYLLLARSISARAKQAVILLLVCAGVLALRCYLVFVAGAPQIRTFVGTDTRIDSILFGCALGVFGNPALDPTTIARRTWLRVLLPVGLVTLLVCFALGDWIPFRETARYSLQGIALAPVFICAVRYPDVRLFRWLNRPLVRHWGALSYSLYLVHAVVIGVLERSKLPVPVAAAGALAISVGVAELFYRFVELPCARLRRRISARATPLLRPAA